MRAKGSWRLVKGKVIHQSETWLGEETYSKKYCWKLSRKESQNRLQSYKIPFVCS